MENKWAGGSESYDYEYETGHEMKLFGHCLI